MEIIRSKTWFTKVFDSHYEHLRNYLYYLSGDIQWSEDAVQEVFLALWEKRNSVNEETIQPFLFTMARNVFLKQKRHEAVHLKFIKKYQAGEETAGDSVSVEADEFDRALQIAISQLPEKCRIVFLMSRMDGINNPMIAADLKVSVKAVEKQITKALKILRSKLEEFK